MAGRDDHPDYRDCTDENCPRFPCRVYRTGVQDGYEVGRSVGQAEGYADGYADGERDGYAAGYRQGQADYEPKVIYITVSSGS